MEKMILQNDITWEFMWAPYDQKTYQYVLEQIHNFDNVLEIGAGDLRLAIQIAKIARQVTAIEIHRDLLEQAQASYSEKIPPNLSIIAGDACKTPFPPATTLGVLLMRHCTHFALYASKLKSIGCKLLITNARWRLGVETINLQAPRESFNNVKLGWYGCQCGSVGFIPGPVEDYTIELDQIVHEVSACPQCK